MLKKNNNKSSWKLSQRVGKGPHFEKGSEESPGPRVTRPARGAAPPRVAGRAATAAPVSAAEERASSQQQGGRARCAPAGQWPQPRLLWSRSPSCLPRRRDRQGSATPSLPWRNSTGGHRCVKEYKSTRKSVQAQHSGSKGKENILERDYTLQLNKC